MNLVFLSPHFPPNYHLFCVRLKDMGVNVLGIADAPYEELNEELKSSLTEYYKVDNMEDYDQILKAVGFFTHKYGKIDRVESHNEHWLEIEARLRSDFNMFGINSAAVDHIKLKSLMKKKFKGAGLSVAQGKVVKDIKEAESFIKKVSYPVIAKPDKGVGASNTYKIHNRQELEDFFAKKTPVDYIMEEFVEGNIYTFDGLTDREGNIVFYTSHTYGQGVMESVHEDNDMYYYSFREIPADLEDAGFKIVKAFNVKEKFFHFEFFRKKDGNGIIPLEVNIRPPGGLTTDMFNFACDIDVYKAWAEIIATGKLSFEYSRKFHCCYIGRKYSKNYTYTHDEVIDKYKELIVLHKEMPPLFHIMGNYAYLVRHEDFNVIKEAIDFILMKSY